MYFILSMSKYDLNRSKNISTAAVEASSGSSPSRALLPPSDDDEDISRPRSVLKDRNDG